MASRNFSFCSDKWLGNWGCNKSLWLTVLAFHLGESPASNCGTVNFLKHATKSVRKHVFYPFKQNTKPWFICKSPSVILKVQSEGLAHAEGSQYFICFKRISPFFLFKKIPNSPKQFESLNINPCKCLQCSRDSLDYQDYVTVCN